MFFVVYQVNSGKTVSVYERESSAKSQVTKNNRVLIMDALRDKNKKRDYFLWDRREEWNYCSYSDYASHFYQYQKSRK
jgi:hypothetical protein